MSILENIKTSADVKNLNVNSLPSLCEEIRREIISVISKNGGHLSSNLGIVETTVALHYVFDFPKDKLIFDVGHQCYTHKLLSDRKQSFSTIRQTGGISGFPCREESEYDAFSAGHAGTSIAAGIGYAEARDKQNKDYAVINVVGDGSLINGLNLEAISSSQSKPKNLIVILNDNGMSISDNGNGFYKFLTKRTTKQGYIKSKRAIKRVFGNSFVTRALRKFRGFIKRLLNKDGNYFEQFGFKYVGIANGNDVKTVVKILKNVKEAAKDKAIFLHIKTTKGKGLQQVEQHADIYHGVGTNLDPAVSTGFGVALGNKLNKLIEQNSKVVAITAGMQEGTGLKAVAQAHPHNFYDVGIAEEYAVTLSAGMAAGGLKPVVAVYSTFLQRAYDQILHDVCMQNLPVIFCIDRAGLVGADGQTHQGVFDLSYLTHMPNITVLCPRNCKELDNALDYALTLNSPVAIRYPKSQANSDIGITTFDGKWEILQDGSDIAVLAVGPKNVDIALEFAQKFGKSVKVVSARVVKPLDQELLDKVSGMKIITLEENALIGGFGSLVVGYYNSKGVKANVVTLGVKDRFIKNGTINNQFAENGITVDRMLEIFKREGVKDETNC